MESFGLYLLKSAVWLTGFALVFLVVLRNERYFQLNRIYLLSGIVASIVFPFYTWHYAVMLPSFPAAEVSVSGLSAVAVMPEKVTIPIYWWFYLAGTVYLVFRLIRQTWMVIRKLQKAGYVKNGSVKLVRTSEYAASFSFFSFVFVNPSTTDIEMKEIVNHEREHIQQRHWFDLLLVELLCMLQWFNPFIWIYSHLIRQNHEYLADERALQSTSNPAIYQATLLNQMFGAPVISLANSFSYSLNKKRFKMMKKKIDSPFRKLKMLLVLPLVAMVFYAFAKPEYITTPSDNQMTNVSQATEGKIVKGKVIRESDGKPLPGVSIILVGTTTGTMPDSEGNFELGGVSNDAEIAFSFVGFKTEVMKPDFNNLMIVKMAVENIGIDKVIVVGYGISKASTPQTTPSKMRIIITPPYSYSLVKNVSQLEKEFLKNSSENPPLLLLDGEVINKSKMESLNPLDIGCIDALKDKSAIDIYGYKGKNGVIEIVSKSKMVTEEKIKADESIVFDDPKKEPLINLDGKIIDYNTMRAIKSDQIESVNVLKDKMATDKYGEKGKNGVLELTLKKGATITARDVAVVDYGKTADLKNAPSPLGFNIRTKDSKEPPLFIIAGTILPESVFKTLDPETIQSVNVLKGESATAKYGDQAKNGAVEVTLKTSARGWIDGDSVPGQDLSIKTKIFNLGPNSKNNPLFMLDGVIIDKGRMDAVNPDNIESITVLKDKSATAMYGEKAKDGVILITSKKKTGAITHANVDKTGLVGNSDSRKMGKEVFVVVEQMPEFPGGELALRKFIAQSVKYPVEAQKAGVMGKVFVTFIVNSDGKVENAKVTRGIHPALDAEAIRVLNTMPDWKPGMQHGKAVDVVYAMPIEFLLQ